MFKIEVPPYKVCGYTDKQIGLYSVRFGTEVIGYVETEEELHRTINILARALKHTGEEVEIKMEEF